MHASKHTGTVLCYKSIRIIIGGYHMVVGVEEVGVIGKPAEAKDDQHNDEHLGQLKIVYGF